MLVKRIAHKLALKDYDIGIAKHAWQLFRTWSTV